MVTDSQGKTAQGTVTVTVDAYTQTILNWANPGDFSVYADDSQTALTEISTRVGSGVVIPNNATNVTIKNASAWTAGNVVTFNSKNYVVDTATCITMTVEDLKTDADMTIANGDFTETSTYAVTMPADGVTGTWTFQTLSGTVGTDKVPQGATVTLTGLDGTYYVKKGTGSSDGDFTKADGDFAMPAGALDLSKKYHKVSLTPLDTSSVTTELNSGTLTATYTAAYVEEGQKATVNFTYSGTTSGAIYAVMDTVDGLTSTAFATKAELVDNSASSATVSSDDVTVAVGATSADLTISYTLSNS